MDVTSFLFQIEQEYALTILFIASPCTTYFITVIKFNILNVVHLLWHQLAIMIGVKK
jgi:hypothetical protein